MNERPPKQESNIVDLGEFKERKKLQEENERAIRAFHRDQLAFIEKHENFVSLLDNIEMDDVTLLGSSGLEGDTLVMSFRVESPANDIEIRMDRESEFVSFLDSKGLDYKYDENTNIFSVFSPVMKMETEKPDEEEIAENIKRWEDNDGQDD